MNDTKRRSSGRSIRGIRRAWLAASAVGCTWLLGGLVPLAQAAQTASPPKPGKPWLQWLMVIAFGALCVGIAFKNPKRSHQG